MGPTPRRAALCALGALALAAPAEAAVAPPHAVSVTTSNGPTLEGEGYGGGQALAVAVDRPDAERGTPVRIATATASTDGTGAFIVNNPEPAEPGAVVSCWATRTPQVLPGDTISIGADTMVVQDVAAGAPAVEGADVVMRGHAATPAGRPIGAALVSASLFSDNRWDSPRALSGSRILPHDVLRFDAGSANWTARFIGLGERDRNVATDAATPSVAASDAAETATTVFEVGGELGPLNAPCTAPLASNAVTAVEATGGTRSDVVNGATDGLVVTGSVQGNAVAAALRLDDSSAATGPVNIVATMGPQAGGNRTWRATVTRAQLDTLRDGPLRVAGRYGIPGGTIEGVNTSIVKDTVAPAAVTASLPPGGYTGPVSTTLSAEPGARIVYTTDRTQPTPASPVASGPIPLAGPTLVTAYAIDAAGNDGPTTGFAYAVTASARAQAIASLSRLSFRSKAGARSLRLARRQGLRFVLTVPAGTRVLRVRLFRVRGSRRPVFTSFRRVRRAGTYRLRLRSKAMRRRLRRGGYRLQVTAGDGRGTYGVPQTLSIRLR